MPCLTCRSAPRDEGRERRVVEQTQSVRYGRDDRPGALLDEKNTKVVSVVGLVRDQVGRWLKGGQERSSAADVGGLTWRQEDGGDAALFVRDRVDLGRPSTSRPADRLALLPPSARRLKRHLPRARADHRALDQGEPGQADGASFHSAQVTE